MYLRDAKERITWQTVRDNALGVSESEKIDDFNVSDGWMTKLMEIDKFQTDELQSSLLFQMNDCCSAHLSI